MDDRLRLRDKIDREGLVRRLRLTGPVMFSGRKEDMRRLNRGVTRVYIRDDVRSNMIALLDIWILGH